jgi:hypothetical protein
MSPRAACRLITLGFSDVYDYVDGKADWFAAGLGREGTLATATRTGHLAHRDVPTCSLDERASDVARRVGEAGWECSVAVEHDGVVLGVLDAGEEYGERLVEDAMSPGPSTYRPNVLLDEIVDHLRRRKWERVLITTSDGRLVGLLRLAEAAAVLEQEEDPP